jgi:hypothetical protein
LLQILSPKLDFSCSSPNQCLASLNSASLPEVQLARLDQNIDFARHI